MIILLLLLNMLWCSLPVCSSPFLEWLLIPGSLCILAIGLTGEAPHLRSVIYIYYILCISLSMFLYMFLLCFACSVSHSCLFFLHFLSFISFRKYFWHFQDMSRYVQMCQDMSRDVKICQEMSKRYHKIWQDMSKYVKICQDISRYDIA